MAIVNIPTGYEQKPTLCNNPDSPKPPQWEDHKACPDPLYCTTGRTVGGLRVAMATTYEGALLNRVRR